MRSDLTAVLGALLCGGGMVSTAAALIKAFKTGTTTEVLAGVEYTTRRDRVSCGFFFAVCRHIFVFAMCTLFFTACVYRLCFGVGD